jgi:hypothetical protein
MSSFALSLVGKLHYLPIQFRSHHDDSAYLARAVTQYRKKGPLEAQYLLPLSASSSARWTTSQLCRLVNQEKGAWVFHVIIKRTNETVERITYGLPSRSEIELERMLESSPSMEDPDPILEDPTPIVEDPTPIMEDSPQQRTRRKRRRRYSTTPPVTQRNLRRRR